MAPIDGYLMDRTQEIALARSAAPTSISRDATILVLTKIRYETAVKGSNGFVCMVERGWVGVVRNRIDARSRSRIPASIRRGSTSLESPTINAGRVQRAIIINQQPGAGHFLSHQWSEERR